VKTFRFSNQKDGCHARENDENRPFSIKLTQMFTEMYLFCLSYLLIFHYDHILPDGVIQ